ncbi:MULTISPECIES: hypothetical protein [Nocardioides]|uniref:Uncharacterized protein n=1 Tax=Nocardioides kribbensis TaxID=305517 RepID=A0ABV1NYI9_9ACTN|nr:MULTISPECIES: hypothetical protein [unclassified Nocardioides]KQP66419.1 hypothetical protein ASF47_01020 [Nocardioides sp. Leaf285]KQQ41871.1 hypothetical protein ASF50_13310 [Nocardioides sp. Leaf307]
MSADMVVNVAKAAWEVFKDGAPSGEITSSTANAVPQVDDWQTLAGARGPMAIRGHWERLCAWPFEDYVVADFTFLLKWDYAATYRGGGAFIPNLWLEVPSYDIFWGQHLDLRLTVRNPTNAGTPQAPLARLPVTIAGTASNGLRNLHVEWGLTVFGDGTWQEA